MWVLDRQCGGCSSFDRCTSTATAAPPPLPSRVWPMRNSPETDAATSTYPGPNPDWVSRSLERVLPARFVSPSLGGQQIGGRKATGFFQVPLQRLSRSQRPRARESQSMWLVVSNPAVCG